MAGGKSEQYSLFFIRRFKGKVLFNVPMKDYTSFKIGGPADVMAFPKDEGDLKDLVTFAEAKHFQYYILSAGTNILVRDAGMRGIVINMTEGFKDITWTEESKAVVGAGVRLAELCVECRERGLSGVEFSANIPGTVGGAVLMNAGAYGSEMKEVVDGVEFMDAKGRKGFLSNKEIGFKYRSTAIPKGAIITRAHMSFVKSTPDSVGARMNDFREKRKATSKITHPNAGSIFKNPAGKFAGVLIDEAGLKGEQIGKAKISEIHGNYIVNLGGAKAKDVLQLMALVRDNVYGTTGVTLEPEIKVVGED
ncbi:MAG: UDP-N-acetylmuramate dehydrogenase [Nitrospirota bacterium]|nr:UDP-N-acetylmuramate dehydrogenase [Nitrospirota bacterium]